MIKQNDFLFMIDTAIKYFDPDEQENEAARKILEIPNETTKIESDRLGKKISATLSKIKLIESENKTISGGLGFTINQISEIQADTTQKLEKIREIEDSYEIRTKYLEEVYAELTTHRRLETNKYIAQRRKQITINDDTPDTPISSNTHQKNKNFSKLKSEVEALEDKLEKSIIRINALNQDLRKKDELIRDMKFRLKIETKEQNQLSSQNLKLNGEVVIETNLRRPSTGVIRSKTIIR